MSKCIPYPRAMQVLISTAFNSTSDQAELLRKGNSFAVRNIELQELQLSWLIRSTCALQVPKQTIWPSGQAKAETQVAGGLRS